MTDPTDAPWPIGPSATPARLAQTPEDAPSGDLRASDASGDDLRASDASGDDLRASDAPGDDLRASASETRSPVLPLTGDNDDSLAAARDAVSSGHCVVLPTDTVYGIGADAFNAGAVRGLLEAKGRGRDMPPPVLMAEPGVMMALATDIPDAAKRLAERFWPGALTLVLTAQPSLSMDLGETRGTIAVRVPDHAGARALLRRTGPLAVSSANRSGQPAATTVEGAVDQLGDRVAVYLDGGPTAGPEPSTIVDFSRSEYGAVLRHGRIGLDALRDVVPYLDDDAAPAAEPEPEPETYASALGLASLSDQVAHADAARDPEDDPAYATETGPAYATDADPATDAGPAVDVEGAAADHDAPTEDPAPPPRRTADDG